MNRTAARSGDLPHPPPVVGTAEATQCVAYGLVSVRSVGFSRGSTTQVGDIHVGTPKRGSTNFISTNHTTTNPIGNRIAHIGLNTLLTNGKQSPSIPHTAGAQRVGQPRPVLRSHADFAEAELPRPRLQADSKGVAPRFLHFGQGGFCGRADRELANNSNRAPHDGQTYS